MKSLGQKRYSRMQVILVLSAMLALMAGASYGVGLNTFTSGTTIYSSSVNGNFTALNNALGIYKYGSFNDWSEGGTTGSASVQNVGSISITIPASGCVSVRASANMYLLRGTSTTTDTAYVGIGSTAASFLQYNYVYAPSGSAPNYTYYYPYVEYRSGILSAGTYVYYMNARKGYVNANSMAVFTPRMSATYFPNCP